MKTVLLLGSVLALLPGPALGHGLKTTAHHDRDTTGVAADPAADTINVTLLDLELVDQDGRSVRFKSEAIGERIVVMDFIYTTCSTLCPVLSTIMAQVQDRLGDRLGRDVSLLSISVDPATDTPERLKESADRWGAGPGWRWLTGYKPEVDRVLDALAVYTPDFTEHPSVVLVGDGKNGGWTRFYGFPSPDEIVAKVDQLAAGRRSLKTSLVTMESKP